jgi:hypothetical protein
MIANHVEYPSQPTPTAKAFDMVRTSLTTSFSSGVDLTTVAGRLGHGSGGKTTLAIYSHFLRKPDQAASAIMAAVLKPTDPISPTPTGKVIPIRGRQRAST